MWTWIRRAAALAIVGFLGFATYDKYRAGYWSMPELQDDEYPVSYRNGFRAIVTVENVTDPIHKNSHPFFRSLRLAMPDRRYIPYTYEVAPWFQKAWTRCEKPEKGLAEAILESFPDEERQRLVGATLDAVCGIKANGESIPRGLLFSVPRL